MTAPAAPTASVLESPLQAFLGLDLQRQIWMPVLPEREAETPDPPRFSVALESDYLKLIRKTGNLAYDFGAVASALRLTTEAIPGMEFRVSAERADRDLDLGDTSTAVDLGGAGWGWTADATCRLTPWLMPTVTVGGESQSGREHAVRALGMRGRIAFGDASETVSASRSSLEWAAETGERNSDHPLTAHVKEYRPLLLALQMRKRYESASLKLRHGAWSAQWAGAWEQRSFPRVPAKGYYLGDSGSSWSQSAKLAYDGTGEGALANGDGRGGGSKGGEGVLVTADFRLGHGKHQFRGANRKESSQTRFSYQEAEQRSYSARLDLESRRKPWEWGAFAGLSELEYNALRPETAFNRHFWDRNGVIDSYQGSLLGLFNTETWLLNGAVYIAQGGGGLWAAKQWRGWRCQGGLGYARLLLEANSSLTKRESSFLLAFKEEDFETTYPTVTADVLTPELRVTGSAGRTFLSASAAQALPVRVRIEGKGPTAGGGGSEDKDAYSGGTRGRIEIGWRLP